MPVAKPDKVITHRIELQKTERDILEAAVLVRGAGSILSGIGTVLAPFAGGITAIMAAYIAKEGLEDVTDWAKAKLSEQEDVIDDEYAQYLRVRAAAMALTDAEGNPLNPNSQNTRPMTRAEYEQVHGRANLTNAQVLGLKAAQLIGLTTTDVSGPRSRADLEERRQRVCDRHVDIFGFESAFNAGVVDADGRCIIGEGL